VHQNAERRMNMHERLGRNACGVFASRSCGIRKVITMARYAATTDVPVEKSKMEIEATVRRYGADGFMSGWSEDRATVQFRCQNRHIRFVMTLPRADEKRFTHQERSAWLARTPESARKLWEQACRQKWRALTLLVKAKLEAVDAGISSFEEAFFADIVLPDGKTVYEAARGQLALAYESGKSVPLLPGVAN
jgi:hypothetical protein